MQNRDNCCIDGRGNLSWKIYRHRPNTVIAVFMLAPASLIAGLAFFHDGSDFNLFRVKSASDIFFSMGMMIVFIVVLYLTSICDIMKRLFFNYIVEVYFQEDNLKIRYKKGNIKIIRYDEIGFIYFGLTEGIGSHKHFYPSFRFYYRDKSSKLLDDVLYKKGYLIFQGEVLDKRDYLMLKEFLSGKGLRFYEPPEAVESFERGRIR